MEKLYLGDCLDVLPTLPDNSVDSIVTDPPYHLVSIVKRFGKEGSAPAKFGTDGAFKRASTGFMGKTWDGGDIAFNPDMWRECLRVLKPGGHLLSFSGTRTYHRMAVAIEDAGFEVRDMIEWCYGSGFPKSHNIGKNIEKIKVGGIKNLKQIGTKKGIKVETGTQGFSYSKEYVAGKSMGGKQISGDIPVYEINNEWEGWGTALKPAHEPICLARKPLSEKTVAENVLKYGTGGINIDESRVETSDNLQAVVKGIRTEGWRKMEGRNDIETEKKLYGTPEGMGRFPANLIHDNSEEVRECFPDAGKGNGKGAYNYAGREYDNKDTSMFNGDKPQAPSNFNDSGSAARFFKSILYYPKASKSERNKGMDELEAKEWKQENSPNPNRKERPFLPVKNNHPTVKPIALMSYLIKMITPKGGIVLDPFAGSGSTLVAAKENGFGFIGIELTPEYIPIIEARVGIKAETITDNTITKEVIGEVHNAVPLESTKKIKTCSCGGRIVKTKSGVLTCESCFNEY